MVIKKKKILKKSLAKDEREFLSAQMNLGIPKSEILKDITTLFSPTKEFRIPQRKIKTISKEI